MAALAEYLTGIAGEAIYTREDVMCFAVDHICTDIKSIRYFSNDLIACWRRNDATMEATMEARGA